MASLELDGWGNGYDQEQEQEICLSELEEQQEWNQDLKSKNEKLLKDLKRLAVIEGSQSTFGKLTFEEEKEKLTILNKYL